MGKFKVNLSAREAQGVETAKQNRAALASVVFVHADITGRPLIIFVPD